MIGARLFLLASVTLLACKPAPDAPRFVGAGHASPHPGGSLVFTMGSDLRTMDPHFAFDEVSQVGIKHVFEALFDYDREGRVIPLLADGLPSYGGDGKLLTVNLRHGVRFHNGREVTADDVKWSLDRMLDPAVGSPGHIFFTALKGVQVLGPHQLQFELIDADQTFVNALATMFASVVPREVYGPAHGRFKGHPVGTGPYTLESWEPGVRLTFRRNPHYWNAPKPFVAQLVFELGLPADTGYLRLRTGELDHLGAFTMADAASLRRMPAWKDSWIEQPGANVWGLVMNCEMPPFDNVHIRRAVSFAIDRDRWARARGYRILPTGQMLPPGMLGYDANLPDLQRFDLAQAKREMALAGHPDGLAQEVELWAQSSARGGGVVTELLIQDLEAIGIKVRVKPVSFPVYLQQTGRRRTAQLFFSGWTQDFPDPADFLDVLLHSRAVRDEDAENRSFYVNHDLDQLLDGARREPDRAAREAMYKVAQSIVARDAPWAFIWNDLRLEAWQPYVKNYRPHIVWSLDFRDTWLDLPRSPSSSVAKRSVGGGAERSEAVEDGRGVPAETAR